MESSFLFKKQSDQTISDVVLQLVFISVMIICRLEGTDKMQFSHPLPYISQDRSWTIWTTTTQIALHSEDTFLYKFLNWSSSHSGSIKPRWKQVNWEQCASSLHVTDDIAYCKYIAAVTGIIGGMWKLKYPLSTVLLCWNLLLRDKRSYILRFICL